MEKQDLQAGENWRIPVLQLLDPGVKNKTKPIYEWKIIVFKPGSRLDWKIVESF